MNKFGKIAISEIIILIIGTIAFAYIAGIGSLPLVSAAGNLNEPCLPNNVCNQGTCQNSMCKGSAQTGAGTLGGFFGSLSNFLGFRKSGMPNPIKSGAGTTKVLDGVKYTQQSDGSWSAGTPYKVYTNEEFTKLTTAPGTFSAGQGWGAVGNGVLWAVGTWIAVRYLAPMFGASEEQAQAIAWAASAGMLAGKSIYNLGQAGAFTGKAAWLASPGVAIGIGVAVSVIVFLLVYKKEGTRDVTYSCNIWDANTGGSHCEECNQFRDFPCSEYQCKSLGQACQLLNQGTKEEKCAWVNPKDVEAPIINSWLFPLTTGYIYTPDNATNPPDRGIKIIAPTSDKCVPAFTPLVFGIQTNEPAKCKVDSLRQANFSDFKYFFGGSSLFAYNHTQTMSLPGVKNAEQEGANITLENDGEVSLYVKCQDANGNSNAADFVFKFCVAKGPDTTAPVVVDTSVLNNMPVAVGQDSVPLNLYINEPAQCKWSTMDKEYEQMETTMDCSKANSISDAVSVNSRLVYTCKTTLEGIKDKFENKFYFRCRDQPKLTGDKAGDRNTNAQSYVFTVFGTETLVIDDAGPNETVSDSTEAVKVTLTAKTSGGYKEGESICYYKDKDASDQLYVEFFNTGTYTHSTDLYLAEEDYQYIIRCVDLGGNSDKWQVNFTVESDSEAPVVARAYKEENYLKIVTSENATCVYDTASCNYLFEDGLPMNTGTEGDNHFVDWSTKTKFYIKCKDDFGNQPATDKCSAIVRPI